jgi:hypothetical protein
VGKGARLGLAIYITLIIIFIRLKELIYKLIIKENLKIKKKVKGILISPYLSPYKIALYI